MLPQALPGIMTGGILAVSARRAKSRRSCSRGGVLHGVVAGEVERSIHGPRLSRLCCPPIAGYRKTRPILYATVLVLLILTFALNFVAVLIRARVRKTPGARLILYV